MKKARVTKDEVCAAVRAAGIGPLNQVAAVVLETDGSFSVIKTSDDKNGSTQSGRNGVGTAGITAPDSSLSDVRRISRGSGFTP